jgi:hypothetical protein
VHPHLLRGARSLAHSLAACMRLVLRGVNGSRGSAGSRRRRTPVTSPPISGRRRLAAANNSRLPVTGAHSLHKRCCCWFLLFTSRSSLPLAHNTRRSPLLPRALHQLIISVRSRAQARVCKLMALYGLVKCRPNWQLPLTCKVSALLCLQKSEQMRVCLEIHECK